MLARFHFSGWRSSYEVIKNLDRIKDINSSSLDLSKRKIAGNDNFRYLLQSSFKDFSREDKVHRTVGNVIRCYEISIEITEHPS